MFGEMTEQLQNNTTKSETQNLWGIYTSVIVNMTKMSWAVSLLQSGTYVSIISQ
jgi:hypothetical protein